MKDHPVKSSKPIVRDINKCPRNSYLRRGILFKLKQRVRNKES